jgi:hypothetical protein
MELFPVLMHDIKLAVAVSNSRWNLKEPPHSAQFWSPVVWRDWMYNGGEVRDPNEPLVPAEYLTHPSPDDAERWAKEAKDATLIAYDIETPRSISEDEADELGEVDILSIQFSARRGSGVFLPWREPYIEIARGVLGGEVDKAGANTWRFDDPLLEAHGCQLGGRRHDVRWAWHALQPDLRGSLQFIASFYQSSTFYAPWKHLSSSHKAVYGIMDVDAVQHIVGG